MIPQKIGRYEIKAELGRGGMATVYHAYDPRFRRDVAIKVLPREFLHDATIRARFEREAQTIAALEHAAIVPVYDFGEEGEQLYLVMRYMSGGSLADRIQRGALLPDEALRIVTRLAPALDQAHAVGIIHRDLKPSNILFDQYSEAFLSDFGIVKLAETTAHLTGDSIVGTPAYIAPEMSKPGGLSPLVDIYALGVTLYQMLTGKLPFEADTPMGMLLAHTVEPIPDVREWQPNLPIAAQRVIERVMAKTPDERYQTAGEMAADLETALVVSSDREPVDLSIEAIESADTAPVEMRPFLRRQPETAPPVSAQAISAPPPRHEPMARPEGGTGVLPWVLIIGGVGALVCIALAGILILAGVLGGREGPAEAGRVTPEITRTLAPTPTLPFGGDVASLEYSFGGISLLYPADWAVEYISGQVILAESQRVLEDFDWNAGAIMLIFSGTEEDIAEDTLGIEPTTEEEFLDTLIVDAGFQEMGDREVRYFQDQAGLGVPIQIAEDDSVQGYLVVYISEDVVAVMLALSPEEEWEDNWNIFETIFETTTFYTPVESVDRGSLSLEQITTATLDPGGTDSWTYESSGDEYVTVEVTALDDWDPTLEAFDEGGESIAYNDDSDGLNPALVSLHLDAPGRYEFLVRSFSGYGLYEIRLLGGQAPGGGSLTYGQTVQGTIDRTGEREEWTFEGRADDAVRISMVGLGSFDDTYLELYGPDGEELVRDDDSGEGLFALIDGYVLPETGTYTIVARAFGSDTGPYELSLDQVEVQEIAYGQTVYGELTEENPQAYWVFEAVAGDVVTISMIGQSGLTDTYLELYGPDGRMLTQDDDSGQGLFALISNFRLSEAGTYRILARGFLGRTGPYELRLSRGEIVERPIRYGQTVSSELTEASPREYWTFAGRAGDVVTISMIGLEDLTDTYLELHGPDGSLLIANDDGGEGLFALIDSYELSETGSHMIITRGFGGRIGPYELSLISE